MIYGAITNPSVVDHGVRSEYQVRLGYKVNSQDIESNTSNITLQLEVRSINSNYYSYGFQQTTTIDGINLSAKTFDMRPVNTWKVFGTRTFDVLHDENREYKATKTASFTTNANLEWTLKSGSASVEVDLGKLHTPPTINSLQSLEENNAINNSAIIVQLLSQKKFILDISTFEEAKLKKTNVYNNNVLLATSENNELFVDFSKVDNLSLITNGENKYCVLTFEAIDDMDGVGVATSQFDVIEYFKPNLIQTSSNIKRNGQVSGKVKLNLVGKFFNESTDVLTNTINLQFAYWKKGEEESTTFYDIPFTKTNNDIILSDYALAIDNAEIEDVDKDYAYYFKIKATDRFENKSEIILLCPVGEYVWAEFKNRVDFKKITIKNYDPFAYSTEETIVGTYMDKPRYRKVIDVGKLTQQNNNFYNHNIENLGQVTDARAIGYDGTHYYPIPFAAVSSMYSNKNVGFRVNSTQIAIGVGATTDFQNHTAIVILEYTKTTD